MIRGVLKIKSRALAEVLFNANWIDGDKTHRVNFKYDKFYV